MILCITHSRDFYNIDLVMEYFQRQGAEAIRLNTDEFPESIQIEYGLGSTSGFTLHTNGRQIPSSQIQGVWYRKVWASNLLSEIEETYRPGVQAELDALLSPFLKQLECLPKIGSISKGEAVNSNKIKQLQTAQAHGLTTPATLITSRKDSLMRFFEQQNGNIIAKLQRPLSYGMEKQHFFFHTTSVSRDDLEEMGDSLSLCPMVFQEKIEKAYELRVAYVNGKFFTGKIDSSQTEMGQDDWRASEELLKWEPYSLPKEEEQKLVAFMRELELDMGAIDIIRSTSGAYVFLEVNPAGEWGMLQKDLGYPIAESIADDILRQIEKKAANCIK